MEKGILKTKKKLVVTLVSLISAATIFGGVLAGSSTISKTKNTSSHPAPSVLKRSFEFANAEMSELARSGEDTMVVYSVGTLGTVNPWPTYLVYKHKNQSLLKKFDIKGLVRTAKISDTLFQAFAKWEHEISLEKPFPRNPLGRVYNYTHLCFYMAGEEKVISNSSLGTIPGSKRNKMENLMERLILEQEMLGNFN